MDKTEIAWTRDVPLVTNPVVVRQLVWTFLLSGVIITAFLGIAFWSTGSLDTLPAAALLIFAVCGGLLVLGFLAALLIYGNRMTMRFRVSENGIETEVIDRRPKQVGGLLLLAGILTGKPGAAGTGLLALSNSQMGAKWQAIQGARFSPRRQTIELANGWRTIAVLFCTAENYAAVDDAVRRLMPKPGASTKHRFPLLRALAWTAAVVAASLPSFAMPSPFEADLLAAMILVAFAVATVWLLPPLAWALLAAIIWIIVVILGNALEIRPSIFGGEASFPAWHVASGDDWAMLAIEGAALAFLAWFAWRALTGRFVPVLFGDMAELTDDDSVITPDRKVR